MHIRQVLTTILLVILSVVAVGVALSAVLLHGDVAAALVAAVALLALAQLVAYISRAGAKRDALEQVSDLMMASDTLTRDVAIMRSRLGKLESRIAGDAEKAIGKVNKQIEGLEDRLSGVQMSVQQARQEPPPRPDPVPRQEPAARQVRPEPQVTAALAKSAAPVRETRPEPILQAEPEPVTAQLYLEPIVRLENNKTAYYRATFSPDTIYIGQRRPGTTMQRNLELFEQVAPVIRRFQERNRSVGVFCPLTAQALADDRFIDQLVRFVETNSDIAGALVIDIAQEQLAELDEQGQQGLAYLAQLGATFSLSNCRLNVPDLETLKRLGFGFIDADVELLIDAKRHVPSPAAEVVAEVRRLNFSIIAANVSKDSELSWIQDSFELARGSRFSPPRPVRHDITSDQGFSAAA